MNEPSPDGRTDSVNRHPFGGLCGGTFARKIFSLPAEVTTTLRGGVMPVKTTAEKWTQIHLSASITTDVLDGQLSRVDPDLWKSPLNLDLTAADHIDIAALLYILTILEERSRGSLNTAISVPASRRVRNFLRAWDFPAAASAMSGSSFRNLVWEEDLEYFGESLSRSNVAPHYGNVDETESAFDRLLSKNFFGFMTYVFSSEPQIESIIDTEWTRWRRPLVLSVLNRHLKAPGAEIARVVIYELLANAIQHPQAGLVTIVSQMQEASVYVPESHLAISIWDNGTSLTKTLGECIDSGGSVRVAGTSVDDTFEVHASGWTPSASSYRADWTPGPSATPEELLLASAFPGISRKAVVPTEDLARPELDQVMLHPGFGLHALYRCVVDTFGGTLSIRTGNQVMDLSAHRNSGGDGRSYRARLHRLDGRSFHGNMLTARLPLTNGR